MTGTVIFKFLMTFLFICLFNLCSFITVVQRTVGKQRHLNYSRIASALGCVGEFLQLLDFDSKLVNFFRKLVLPFIIKDILS